MNFDILIGLILGFFGSLVVLGLFLFRIDLFRPKSGFRSAGSLVSQRFSYLQQQPQPVPLQPIHPLLDPYFEDASTTAPGGSSSVVTASSSSTLPRQTLAEVTENYLEQCAASVPKGESTVWLNILIRRALAFLVSIGGVVNNPQSHSTTFTSSEPINSTSSSSQGANQEETKSNRSLGLVLDADSPILQALNRRLASIQRPSFLGPTSLLYVDVGTISPLIHRIELCESRQDFPLELEIDFTYAGDSIIEIATSVEMTALSIVSVATLPLQVALSNLYIDARVRLSLDLDPLAPTVAITLMQEPTIRFDIASAIGAHVQLVNIPHIRSVLSVFIARAIQATAVYPNVLLAPLFAITPTELSQRTLSKISGIPRSRPTTSYTTPTTSTTTTTTTTTTTATASIPPTHSTSPDSSWIAGNGTQNEMSHAFPREETGHNITPLRPSRASLSPASTLTPGNPLSVTPSRPLGHSNLLESTTVDSLVQRKERGVRVVAPLPMRPKDQHFSQADDDVDGGTIDGAEMYTPIYRGPT